MPKTEELTCKAKKSFKNGAWEEEELTLSISGGRVSELAFTNWMSNGKEGGAYSCELNVADGKPGSEWMRTGTTTRIIDKEADPDRESYAEVKRMADGSYEVNLENMAVMPHCGFGSEFPDRVILKRSSPKCVVRH